jgi:hypothetical protein
MKVSCWQNHFLLLRSAPARQAGYAGGVGRLEIITLTNFGLTLPSSYVMVHLFSDNISMDNKCLPSKVFPVPIAFTSTALIVMSRNMFTRNGKK